MGWIAQGYEGAAHVVPDHEPEDVDPHVLSPACWCGPVEKTPGVWTHADELDRIAAASAPKP